MTMQKLSLQDAITQRVLCLDGAMGTMIQQRLSHAGNMDMLTLSHPEIIQDIHRAYLDAGADVIETNTFSSQVISQADYNTQDKVVELNKEAVRIAREIAEEYTLRNPSKPRYVLGSIGPTNKTASLSPDVSDASRRDVTWHELHSAYYEQCVALIEAGVDGLLFETVFDTLNAKAALTAAVDARESLQQDTPLLLSITLTESGRTLSGQTLEAVLASVSQFPLLSVGFNCTFGADKLVPFVRELAAISPYYLTVYPNAGLPNALGQYDQTPAIMEEQLRGLFTDQMVNMVGGCCGTTDAHIQHISKMCEGAIPRVPQPSPTHMQLAGMEMLPITSERNMSHIGERCNVAGSRKFLRLIKEKSYEEAAQIARKQVEDGALILDINMDDGLLDAQKEMVHFLRIMGSDPLIASRPWMIDSSDWSVIEAALHEIQGKPIVNSISLKEGEAVFISHAKTLKKMGAAVVVMAFDEIGQADTSTRKIEICKRAYDILVDTVGFPPQDIIFDPNVLAVATGMEAHRRYALDFIEATQWIHDNLPYAHISGGISNLSFSFRGNNYLREAMHSVFLYHAIQAGLDMAIVNPASKVMYSDIPQDMLTIIEDALLRPNETHENRLIALAEKMLAEKNTDKAFHTNNAEAEKKMQAWRSEPVADRLIHALKHGESSYLEPDLEEALAQYKLAVSIIEGPLMDGMRIVGELFGSGQMFLPQVVKTARTMQQAVKYLQPTIEAQKTDVQHSGKILLATVKGDVHDIGKNIVSVVMACAGYDIIDLGVMVPTDKIIQTAQEEKVDIICLSGLITPSLQEMKNVLELAEKTGLTCPIMIGGATTSALHTALKLAPSYSGAVLHMKDASQNVQAAARLLDNTLLTDYINHLRQEQDELRKSYLQKEDHLVAFDKIKRK